MSLAWVNFFVKMLAVNLLVMRYGFQNKLSLPWGELIRLRYSHIIQAPILYRQLNSALNPTYPEPLPLA